MIDAPFFAGFAGVQTAFATGDVCNTGRDHFAYLKACSMPAKKNYL
jgi:hypothetical protein